MTEPRIITEARALLEMGAAMVDAGTLQGVLVEYDTIVERVVFSRRCAIAADIRSMRLQIHANRWKKLSRRLRLTQRYTHEERMVTSIKLDESTRKALCVGDARLPAYRHPTLWDRLVGAWRGLVNGWRLPDV